MSVYLGVKEKLEVVEDPNPPKDPDNPIEDSANEAVIESKEVVEKGVTDKPTSKEEITKLRQKSIIEKEKSGICKTGYYWCEKRGCIPLKEEMLKIVK